MILPRPPGAPKRIGPKKPKCEHDSKVPVSIGGKPIGAQCSKCRKLFTRDVCTGCGAIFLNPARADRTHFECLSCKRKREHPAKAAE